MATGVSENFYGFLEKTNSRVNAAFLFGKLCNSTKSSKTLHCVSHGKNRKLKKNWPAKLLILLWVSTMRLYLRPLCTAFHSEKLTFLLHLSKISPVEASKKA